MPVPTPPTGSASLARLLNDDSTPAAPAVGSLFFDQPSRYSHNRNSSIESNASTSYFSEGASSASSAPSWAVTWATTE